MKNVIVLGGYGNFGKRIVENLAKIEDIVIFVTGRNQQKASSFVSQLSSSAKALLKPLVLDISAASFKKQLQSIAPDVVIHTSGPFQGQNYNVPQMCAQIGAHYIDLADDRRFVCDINQLNSLAIKNNVLLVSGASSVPGLSSAVIDYYQNQFSVINSIDIAIAPGNKAERGEATVRGILSYTGHPFKVFKNGRWQDAFGWMDARKVNFKGIAGKRWLANVDVPDLELFPQRYSVKQSVRFQAGLELPFLHNSMVVMAYLAKKQIVKNWSYFTKPIIKMSNLLIKLGSDNGAMRVKLEGVDHNGKNKCINWTLYAPNGIGPYIPTLSTIILARKLINEKAFKACATACVDQFTLEDFYPYFNELGIYFKEDIYPFSFKMHVSASQ